MKRKLILSLILGMTSLSALAAEDLVLICSPNSDSMNGLGLTWARLIISQENPEAEMFYRYERTSPGKVLRKMHYDYSGTDSEYILTPDSTKDSALNVHVKRVKEGAWEATFSNDMIDTLSVLPCSEGELQALRG
jgi:hypothetical protein